MFEAGDEPCVIETGDELCVFEAGDEPCVFEAGDAASTELNVKNISSAYI